MQMAGRGLRLHENKEDCFSVDYCENFKRLGFPTQKFSIGLCPRGSSDEPVIDLKECPSCHAQIPMFAAVCPECGHKFEGKDLPDTVEATIPPFGELLAPEQKKQCRDYRKWLRQVFRKKLDVWWAEDKFKKVYGFVPPIEWALGAVFGNDMTVRYNRQIYVRYLRSQLTDPDGNGREIIFYCMRREFGDRQGQDGFRYLYWWQVFSQSTPFVDLAELEQFYKYRIVIAQNSVAANDEVALLLLAYLEGLEYYSRRDQLPPDVALEIIWTKFLNNVPVPSKALFENFVTLTSISGSSVSFTLKATLPIGSGMKKIMCQRLDVYKAKLQELFYQHGYWVSNFLIDLKSQ